MPITPDNNELIRRLHDVYHVDELADIHEAVNGPVRTPEGHGLTFVFKDYQPGSLAFASQHLVGSSAPEPLIERMGPVGSEGFGPVELIDGKTGQSIARVNRNMRRHLEER